MQTLLFDSLISALMVVVVQHLFLALSMICISSNPEMTEQILDFLLDGSVANSISTLKDHPLLSWVTTSQR